MKHARLLSAPSLLLLSAGAHAQAPCGFSFVPGADPTADLAFQAGLCGGFVEEDFELFSAGASVPSFGLGSVLVDVNLVDAGGALLANDASIFSSGAFGTPGVMFQRALLNRNGAGSIVADLELVFDPPVESVAGWLFDDGPGDSQFTLRVTEVGGQVLTLGPSSFTSGVGIEGFFAYRSCTAIRRLQLGDSIGFLELDHFQVGAAIPQANAAPRNGSGVNPAVLTALGAPSLGSTWSLQVDAGSRAGATRTLLFGFTGPLLVPSSTPFGEILVDVSSARALRSIQPVVGGFSTHAFAVPTDPCLANLRFSTQAAILGGGIALTNALDSTLGW
jgi:hypothetical protein